MVAKIVGTGSFLPEKVVSNKELEQYVDTTDEWIRSRTGIEKRHIAVNETTVSMAGDAAMEALKDAGVKAEELDMILVCTISSDAYFPSTACELQRILGATNATAFDISAACAGFLYGLSMINAYIKAGEVKTALVVGAETLSKMMDWSDRSTCVLFGDGAGAVVVKCDNQGILSFVQGSDGTKGAALCCENRLTNNLFVQQSKELSYTQMNGQEVYRFAVKKVPEIIQGVLEKSGVSKEEVKYYILHQANLRIIEAVAKRLDEPIEKFPTNLQECGNISAGSVPILLDHVNKVGQLKRGDKIVLAGFGAGLTYSATVLEW